MSMFSSPSFGTGCLCAAVLEWPAAAGSPRKSPKKGAAEAPPTSPTSPQSTKNGRCDPAVGAGRCCRARARSAAAEVRGEEAIEW
eukprot:gene3428-3294_t